MVDLVRKFHRAGRFRLDAAQSLRSAAKDRHMVDALYLGGYCIECSMKAMILSQVIASEQDEFADEMFRGQAAHNLDMLYHLWLQYGCEKLPKVLLESLRHAKLHWSTDWRYEAGLGRTRRKDVDYVLQFADVLWTWVGRRLT